ncbi:MAG: YtxH domain-containing protein [Rufibacter sp.]
MKDNSKILIAAAAGAAAGVVAGILMAPGAGKDSRDNIMKMAGQLAENFGGQLTPYLEKLSGLAAMLNGGNGSDAGSTMSVGADATSGTTADGSGR